MNIAALSRITIALLLSTPLTGFGMWETVRHDGKDYVTARSIKDFYRFDTLEVRGKQLMFENKAGKNQEGLRTWVLAPAGVDGLDGQLAVPGNAFDSLSIDLATSVHGGILLQTKRPDRGIARSRDPLLAQTKHPAFILELGNLANEAEAALLNDPKYLDSLATGIANGVVRAKAAMVWRKRPKAAD